MTELQKASEAETIAPHGAHGAITPVTQKDLTRSCSHEFVGSLGGLDPMHLSC